MAADLYKAARDGNLEKARELIGAKGTAEEKTAFVNQKFNNGLNAIHKACDNGHVRMVELLLDNGASIESKTSVAHWRPLHCAYFNGRIHVVNLLINRRAKQNAKTTDGEIPLKVAKPGIKWEMKAKKKGKK